MGRITGCRRSWIVPSLTEFFPSWIPSNVEKHLIRSDGLLECSQLVHSPRTTAKQNRSDPPTRRSIAVDRRLWTVDLHLTSANFFTFKKGVKIRASVKVFFVFVLILSGGF